MRPCAAFCSFALLCGLWPPSANCWARSAARRSSAASSSEGKVRASELSDDLGVSLDTVRRDLAELAAAGALRRVHGGALPPASPGPTSFKERLPDDVAAKAGDRRRGRGAGQRPATSSR